MRVLIIFFIGLFLFPALAVYSQYRDPFDSLLPDEEVTGVERPGKGKIAETPQVKVEGILWSRDGSRAIIDGDVYQEGDRLLGVDAEVIRVDKRVVVLSYQGKIFRINVEKGEGK